MKTLLIILCMILSIGCDKNSSAEKVNNAQDCDVKNSAKSSDKKHSKSMKNTPAARLESHIDNLVAMAEPHIKTGNYRRYANDLLNYTEDNIADFIQIFADIFIYTVNEKGPVSRTEKFSEIAHSIFDMLESKQGFMKTIEENERFFSRTSTEISNQYGEWLSDFLDIDGLEKLGRELRFKAQNIGSNRDYYNDEVKEKRYPDESFDFDYKSIEPEITVTAPEMYRDYDANEVSADEKYKGKVIAISGKVVAIRQNSFNDDEIQVHLKGGDYSSVDCKFSAKHKAEAAALKKGDKVKIKGLGAGKEVLGPALEGCSIIDY